MHNYAEQDLLIASCENIDDSDKLYQIFHKLGQCQVKLKKYRESVASLIYARKHLTSASISQDDRIKFDTILKESIKKISKRITESEPADTKDIEGVIDERPKYVTDDFIPHLGTLMIKSNLYKFISSKISNIFVYQKH